MIRLFRGTMEGWNVEKGCRKNNGMMEDWKINNVAGKHIGSGLAMQQSKRTEDPEALGVRREAQGDKTRD